jgi:PAS domain S-box-containing protein
MGMSEVFSGLWVWWVPWTLVGALAGVLMGALKVIRDLTVPRAVEERLRESEKRFRVFFETANDGILLHDAGGRILDANPKALDLLGYERSEILALGIADLHPREALIKSKDAFEEIVERGFVSIGIDFRRKDGTVFPAEISSNLFEIEGRKIIQGIVRDVTKRRETEKAVRDYAEKLRRTNDFKDLFTDILSHDLLNPASVIHNISTILAEREHPRDAKEFDMIRNSARRIMELINNASTYARVEGADSLDREDLDLVALVKSPLESLRTPMEEKKITCAFTGPARAPVTVNPIVEEIFENLLSNAVKYSPEGSEVVVTLGEEGGSWEAAVADRGPGIPDEYKESVFERFKRRDKKGVRGSGLGLAIARRIAVLHDGEVWVEDNPGGGSRFCVRLPRSDSGVPGPGSASSRPGTEE